MGVIHSNHFWIPMPDGARLGARLWMPDDKESYPAILEYLPYRKDDYTVKRDSNTIAHFANHGYACIRVDMRGAGSSDGFKDDEYTDQEIDDGRPAGATTSDPAMLMLVISVSTLIPIFR
mgnify:CR=1 FL=1